MQAHTLHNAYAWYEDDAGLSVCQYVPSEARLERGGAAVTIRQNLDSAGLRDESPPHLRRERSAAGTGRPRGASASRWRATSRSSFALSLRLPWWAGGEARAQRSTARRRRSTRRAPGFLRIARKWHNDRIVLELPRALHSCPLPDRPDTVAVMDGPVVLAGLCGEERTLAGDPGDPSTFLVPDNEKEWWRWLGSYRTVGQEPRHPLRAAVRGDRRGLHCVLPGRPGGAPAASASRAPGRKAR